MKRAGLITAAALLLLLTGCTSTPAPEPAQTEQATVTTDAPDAAPAQVAPTPTPTIDIDADFLATTLVSQIDLSDDAKLSAARFACEQVAAGNLGVVALEGVTEQFNRTFVGGAINYFCPELAEVYTAG